MGTFSLAQIARGNKPALFDVYNFDPHRLVLKLLRTQFHKNGRVDELDL